ncbi:MAG: helix-turn-helix domain-containing protein [Actinomycetota bacterium]|nr:helix-turn-helix domain-containing protein [Actinomycetota bacterium]
MDEAKVLGRRVRELRCWRQLTLREAAGLAGLSFSFWGQVERGESPVANRKTLEAMAAALRVHPAELTGQPWAPCDPVGARVKAGLTAIETALECYELGADPGVPVRSWPQIQADLDRLVTTMRWAGDYAAQSKLAPVLIGELHGAYVRLPHQRREVLLGLMNAYSSAVVTTKRLGARGPADAGDPRRAAVRGDRGRPGLARLCDLTARGCHRPSGSGQALPPLGGRSGESNEQAGFQGGGAGVRDAAPLRCAGGWGAGRP